MSCSGMRPPSRVDSPRLCSAVSLVARYTAAARPDYGLDLIPKIRRSSRCYREATMSEMTQDEAKELGLIAHHWIEHHAGIGSPLPALGSIAQCALPTGYRFPTDHLPEGSC